MAETATHDDVWTQGTTLAAQNAAALRGFRDGDKCEMATGNRCRICWEYGSLPNGGSIRSRREGWTDGPNTRETP